jgi:type IV secretion system protein TrbJ
MRSNFAKALLASAAILALVHTAQAQFAIEFTQLLNNAQLVQHGAEQLKQSAQFAQQITNQVQQIQNQLQMYQNMLQNTATLPTRIWGQAQADLAQLMNLTQQGQSLAYGMSNIDQVFRQRFGTYDSFLGQNITGGSFSQAYSSWSATQRDTIASTLKTTNLTADQITSDATILRQLQAQSESADGQMRALQIGHSLASVQADQMMKLRALIAQQTVMFGQVFGRKQAIEEQQQAIEKRYFETGAAVNITSGKEY